MEKAILRFTCDRCGVEKEAVLETPILKETDVSAIIALRHDLGATGWKFNEYMQFGRAVREWLCPDCATKAQ